MSKFENVAVRHLNANDVFASSGFTVTRKPYTQVRTPKGKMHVEGFYPGQPVKVHVFNASTVVSRIVK